MTDGLRPSVRWTQTGTRCARQPRRVLPRALLGCENGAAGSHARAPTSRAHRRARPDQVREQRTSQVLGVGSWARGSAKMQFTHIRAWKSNRVKRCRWSPPWWAPARTGSSRRHENGPFGAPRQGPWPDRFARAAAHGPPRRHRRRSATSVEEAADGGALAPREHVRLLERDPEALEPDRRAPAGPAGRGSGRRSHCPPPAPPGMPRGRSPPAPPAAPPT